MQYFKNNVFDTANYVAYFATRGLFFVTLCYRALSNLLNSSNIVFVGLHGKVMLLGIDCLSTIIS